MKIELNKDEFETIIELIRRHGVKCRSMGAYAEADYFYDLWEKFVEMEGVTSNEEKTDHVRL